MPLRNGHVRLVVELTLQDGGLPLASEEVRERDLADAMAEVWWASHARKGFPDVPPEGPHVEMAPLALVNGHGRRIGGEKLAGFQLEARNPARETTRCVFSIYALDAVAGRLTERCLAEGKLRAGERYTWHLTAAWDDPDRPRVRPVSRGVRALADAATRPIERVELPLDELLADAETGGRAQDDEEFGRVFYTRAAHDRAEQVARRGAMAAPPVETGGLLVGTLAYCPQAQDTFVVIDEVLEARDGAAGAYSLTFTGATWRQIDVALEAIRRNPARRSWRILGQCHGHNFRPGSTPGCQACTDRDRCRESSAYLSKDDLTWHRAVFHEQPWALSHVFGVDARGKTEGVEGLFGARGGRLAARPYHLIDDDLLERLRRD